MGLDLLIGAVMPIVVEMINRFISGSKLKFIVSLIVPLVAGALLNWETLAGGDVEQALQSGVVIFTAAQGVYKLYFRDSKLQKVFAK